MKSHTSNLNGGEWIRILVAPLTPLALFALVMHAGTGVNLWPSPRPTLDMDRTILVHQIESSRQARPVDVVLLGDSSCLMDVDAARLQTASGLACLNLATVSYLDLDHHRMLLESYMRANPGSPRMVLLLMHPEALRRAGADEVFDAFFTGYVEGRSPARRHTTIDHLDFVLGLNPFRQRILARALPVPLPEAFAARYGFSSHLEEFMTRHQGSLVDPRKQKPSGNPEYRLHPAWESKCRRFRQSLPSTVKLIVGLTPAPENYVHGDYGEVSQSMLWEWAVWLQADAVLRELPATLPESRFATTTHLNEVGARIYTDTVARWLVEQSL